MQSDPVDALGAYARTILPAGTMWKTPDGYPGSLALCILDSIWSIGVNYDHHVVPVFDRYRKRAIASGRDPSRDSPCDLAATIAQAGGPKSFAEAVKTRHRTSSVNGILKAEAADRAARLLCTSGIITTTDLAAREADIKPGWRRIRGQGSGINWRYFLMLAGVDGIKPDRMIHRFITAATGVAVTDEEAVDLLMRVQQAWPEPRLTLLELDHAIRRQQSGRAVN